MSALGHKRTFAVQNGMSALPPKADMCGATRLCPLCANSGHSRGVIEKMAAPSCQGAACRVDYLDFSVPAVVPCQYQFRAPTCCPCRKIQRFGPLKLAF